MSPRRRLARAVGALALLVPTAASALDGATRADLRDAYYAFEVAGYCSLVTHAVAAGFQRRVARILEDSDVDRETLDAVRGEAWQAAHWEWQNRGLGGFRGWCRSEGRAAAEGFLGEPP